MDSVNLRAVGLMGSSAAALEELESLPTRDSIVKHFLLWWNIVMMAYKKYSVNGMEWNFKIEHFVTDYVRQKDIIYIVPLQSITSYGSFGSFSFVGCNTLPIAANA